MTLKLDWGVRDEPKYNLCVKFGGDKMRCKKIPPVLRVAAAKQTAYRMVNKLGLPPGSVLVIKLGQRHEGVRYWFHVQHGKVACRRGFMFGPSCD